MKSYVMVSTLVVVLAVIVCGTVTVKAQTEVNPDTDCAEECGKNSDCIDGNCICHEGFHKKLGQEDCEESVCIPLCLENQRCINSTCICIEGFENFGSGGILNCSKLLVSDTMSCTEECGENANCKEGNCVCNDGYFKEIGHEDCEKSVCSPECGEHEICENSKCICQKGYENFGVGGIVNCTKPHVSQEPINPPVGLTAPLIQSTTTTAATTMTITTTTPHTSSTQNVTASTHKPITTPHINSIQNVTASTHKPITTPHTSSTQNVTTSTHKPTTTKSPQPKPRKSGMNKWTITGIIILVASIVGFGGFMIYRHKQRGEYRATSTTVR